MQKQLKFQTIEFKLFPTGLCDKHYFTIVYGTFTTNSYVPGW